MFLRDLQCFVAVAECRNFTQAAASLYMSQPGLSKTISQLEKELFVSLFERTTRSVQLTPAGEQLLVLSREFLQQCNAIQTLYRWQSPAQPSHLSIGMGDAAESRCLPEIIHRFCEKFPLCNFSFHHYSQQDLLEAISIGDADLGVMSSFAIPPVGFDYRIYLPSPLMLVVPPTHRLAGRDKVRVSELKEERFLSLHRSTGSAVNSIYDICSKAGFLPKIVKETNTLPAMFLLNAAGVGIGIHFLFHKESCSQNLRFIELDTEELGDAYKQGGAALLWKSGTHNPMTDAFMACIDDMPPAAGGSEAGGTAT